MHLQKKKKNGTHQTRRILPEAETERPLPEKKCRRLPTLRRFDNKGLKVSYPGGRVTPTYPIMYVHVCTLDTKRQIFYDPFFCF